MTLYTLGLGCRRGAPPAAIAAAVRAALGAAWSALLLPEAPDDGTAASDAPPRQRLIRAADRRLQVATLDTKAGEPGLLAYCASHRLPLRTFSREALARVTATSGARAALAPPSDIVRARFGVDGVCELAALAASPRGLLLVSKTSRDGVSVALAGPASVSGDAVLPLHDRP